MTKRIRIGILGCGAIGSELARILDRRFFSFCEIACLSDLDVRRAKRLARSLRKSRPRLCSPRAMITRCDFLIEAASPRAASQYVAAALRKNKSVLAMSVGGLVSDRRLPGLAKRSRGRLYLPSGAIAGVDGLLAARMAKIKRVVLTTRKPPRAFAGAPYFKARRMDLAKIRKETLIFRGPASSALKHFPQNINVAGLLSLAGVGPRRTEVRIYASPSLRKNIHEVLVEGDFGRMITRTENVPSPQNPRTSYLAQLSPAALLGKIFGGLQIGT
jgi:aspartate dehydrogenase